MARHLLDRFLLTLLALWLVLTLVFLLVHIVPGDPVEQMLGEGAAPGHCATLWASISRFTCSTAIISARLRAATSGNPSNFRRRCAT